MTFSSNTGYQTMHTILEKILQENLIVNVKYHRVSHEIAYYITASYERLLNINIFTFFIFCDSLFLCNLKLRDN